jgi:hypothetical protein
MGLFDFFSSTPSSNLPSNILSMMENFGRKSFCPTDQSIEFDGWTDCLAILHPLSQKNPEEFIKNLAEAVLPAGGWAVYGAGRLLHELDLYKDGSQFTHDIIMAELQFLRDNGVPPLFVTGLEWDYWHKHKKEGELWLAARLRPTPESAPITDLQPGEVRRIAQLTSMPDSNVIFVQKINDGEYISIVNARKSDDDPQRAEFETNRAKSLYDIYLRIGEALQTPCYWVHDELEPYFPFPKPKIKCGL